MDEPEAPKVPPLNIRWLAENDWYKLVARGSMISLGFAVPAFFWIAQLGVGEVVSILHSYGASIATLQSSVTAGQLTANSTHFELKAFREETTQRAVETAKRLDKIEQDAKQQAERIKEIELKVRVQ